MRQQQSIAFMQGDDADDVLAILTRDGRGENDWTVAAVIEWFTMDLLDEPVGEWTDVTDNHGEQVTERPVAGRTDVMHRLVWHTGLRYVGLSLVRTADDEPAAPPPGYRWATEAECEQYARNPRLLTAALVVPLTVDANGQPYTHDEADLAVPVQP